MTKHSVSIKSHQFSIYGAVPLMLVLDFYSKATVKLVSMTKHTMSIKRPSASHIWRKSWCQFYFLVAVKLVSWLSTVQQLTSIPFSHLWHRKHCWFGFTTEFAGKLCYSFSKKLLCMSEGMVFEIDICGSDVFINVCMGPNMLMCACMYFSAEDFKILVSGGAMNW